MPLISDYLYAKASKNKIPLQGTFELSPVCNFSCKMCYVRRTPAQLQKAGKCIRNWKEWLALGRQCKEEGMLYLLLTGGEPFIYPGFRELYEGLHSMGIVLMINSNGTMIDRDTVEWLKAMAPSRINITLYGASADTYERLTGNRDGFEKAKQAILMLQEAGIPIVINASMIPENTEDLEAIVKFGKEHDLNVRMATYMFPPVRREEIDVYSRFTPEEAAYHFVRKYRCFLRDRTEEYKQFLQGQLDKVFPYRESACFEDSGQQEETWGSGMDYMRCRAGRSAFWISWEGIMTACGMLPFPLETYPFEEEFSKCWLALTEAVRNAKVMEECNVCERKEICHPCVAQLYCETRDVHKKAQYLCDMTDCVISKLQEELFMLKKNDN